MDTIKRTEHCLTEECCATSKKATAYAAVIAQMKARAGQFLRFGYRSIRIYLKRDGFKRKAKRMY